MEAQTRLLTNKKVWGTKWVPQTYKQKYFFFVQVTIITLTICDLLSTWYASPTLKGETNSWVVYFRWGWLGLITSLFVYAILIVLAVKYYCFYFKPFPHKHNSRDSLIDKIKTYFFGSRQLPLSPPGLVYYRVTAVLSFASYLLPYYFASGSLDAIWGNLCVGVFNRSVTSVERTGNKLNIVLQAGTKGELNAVEKILFNQSLLSADRLQLQSNILMMIFLIIGSIAFVSGMTKSRSITTKNNWQLTSIKQTILLLFFITLIFTPIAYLTSQLILILRQTS